MMNFFFDVDGTLLPFGRPVPQSAVSALSTLKEKGHRIFLCTGRSYDELTPQLRSIDFDGGVYSAGANVRIGETSIFQAVANEKQREHFFEAVDRFGLLWLIQSLDGSYANQACMDAYNEILMGLYGRVLEFSSFNACSVFPKDKAMIKMFLISKEQRIWEARDFLEPVLSTVNNTIGIPQTMACEVTIPGLSKASGIKQVLDYYNDSIETSVCFGDGENDLEMSEFCHMSVAMGNACTVLKDKASFVTKPVESNGIAFAVDKILK